MIIEIAHEVPAEKVNSVKAYLSRAALHDAEWSGVKFEIRRGDYTCFPDDVSLDAAKLFNKIMDLLYVR